jgi:hypothetical protein
MTTTATHRALGHRFSLGGNEDGLAFLERIFHRMKHSCLSGPTNSYELFIEDDIARSVIDGRTVYSGDIGEAASRLMTAINHGAVRSLHEHDVIHAAVVSFGGAAIIVAANSRRGKSTLCSALVSAGFGYMSDELAPIGHDLKVEPYAKPITIRAGSFSVIPHLEEFDIARQGSRRWILDAHLISDAGTTTTALPIGLVVIPWFVEGSDVQIRSLSPGEIAAALMTNSFNIPTRRRAGVERMAAVARSTRGVEIIHGNALDAASELRQVAEGFGA